jgi:hypothetical protein
LPVVGRLDLCRGARGACMAAGIGLVGIACLGAVVVFMGLGARAQGSERYVIPIQESQELRPTIGRDQTCLESLRVAVQSIQSSAAVHEPNVRDLDARRGSGGVGSMRVADSRWEPS